MNVLNRQQIEERLRNRELLRNPRRKAGGHFDIEKDSYDLAAEPPYGKPPPEIPPAEMSKRCVTCNDPRRTHSLP